MWQQWQNEAHICFRCRPSQSSRCLVSPAPARWSPSRRSHCPSQNTPFTLLQHRGVVFLMNSCTHRFDEGRSERFIDVVDGFTDACEGSAEIDVCDMKGKEAAPQAEMRVPGDASLMPHLFPCSGSCLHRGAPEPRRCRWTHRWEQQPETDLENEGSGQKAGRGLIY